MSRLIANNRGSRTCVHHVSLAGLLLASLVWAGCSVQTGTPPERAAAAKALFDHATKDFHNPSADANGAEQVRLQKEATLCYQRLLKDYPDQPAWCAQALCSWAGLRAAQTNLDGAVRLYARVERDYPQQTWEVLRALKSAADLLWASGRRNDARSFYQRIVTRFDRPDAPAIFSTVVHGSKLRIKEAESSHP